MSLTATKDPTFEASGQRKPHRNVRPPNALPVPQGDVAVALARGASDIEFFAYWALGIRLNRGQRRFVRACQMRAANGYGPAFLDIAVSAGNRAGKTLVLAIVILHHAFYKKGVKPPKAGDREDLLRWVRAPYAWYHLGPEGKTANLVYDELVKLLTHSHPAQWDPKAERMRDAWLAERGIVQWDKKFAGEYPWIVVHAMFGGGVIHFRHTNEKAKGLLGLDMNGISFDEAAFEIYLDTVRHEVLHLRRLSTGGPIFYISTPTEGYNAFADLWEEGNPENPHRSPRSLSMRLSTRDNIGYGLTQENFDDIVAGFPVHLIPQNIDGFFIEGEGAYFHAPAVEAIFVEATVPCERCEATGTAVLRREPVAIWSSTGIQMSENVITGDCPDCTGGWKDGLPPEQPPHKGHRYVQGADMGISHDATWGLVLDYTRKPWLGVRVRKRQGRQSIPSVVNMIREGHLLYQQDGAMCSTVVDDTGMGGKMYRQELAVIRPLRTFDFAGTRARKDDLLANLRAVIDAKALRLPKSGPWAELRRQLLGYKRDDKKLTQDGVMTLAMAVWHASRNPDNPLPDATFSYFGGSD